MKQRITKALLLVFYAAALSLVAACLVGMLLQFVLPATYEARFENFGPDALYEIQLGAHEWRSMNPRVGLVISSCELAEVSGRMCITLRFQAVETGFETMSDLLANINHDRGFSIQRSPNDMAYMLAWLMSALLFLSLVGRSVGFSKPPHQKTSNFRSFAEFKVDPNI